MLELNACEYDCRGMAQKMSLVQILLHLTENITLSQFPAVTNSYLCHTDFAPACFNAAGHMLKVIVIEKDPL